jgi:hypothetical protein
MTITSILGPAPTHRVEAPAAQETGAFALEYLGPGFHVQLRTRRHGRSTELSGWMTPGRPGVVRLTTLAKRPLTLEADLSPSGRFEFRDLPSGPCRLTFITATDDVAPMTPPFWI